MKNTFLILLISTIGKLVFAQDFAVAKNSTAIKQKIEQKHRSTSSIRADFQEEVNSVMFTSTQKSTGTLDFKKEDKIRWEIIQPQKQIILINGSTVKLSENGKSVSNPAATKVVKKIQGLMLSMLSGEFLNEKDFSIQCYENSTFYKLVLRPKHPRISKYILQIDLIFNKSTLLLHQMDLRESKEQKVIYTFSNVKANQTINDQRFNQF